MEFAPELQMPRRGPARESLAVAALLLAVFALRAAKIDQPIVENYVGRQVPTAMVARNLERGSGFLHPQLDTAPIPNLFLVEPPIYALAVLGVRRATGLPLEAAGRLVSALAIVLAGWGLFGLARRREGTAIALAALAAFAIFPVTIRYGRAFQPDALMLGCVLAGLRCWDEHESGPSKWWLVAGCVFLATGFALKVISACVLVPFVAVIARRRRVNTGILAVALLVPALIWYAHAAFTISAGVGSRASADNGEIWLRALIPSGLLRRETLEVIVRFLLIRAFTPLAVVLALVGFAAARGGDRLWTIWGGSVLATMTLLAAKLHHEYYWLSLAPVMAVGAAKGVALLARRSRVLAAGTAVVLVLLSLGLSATTWRTPTEWTDLAGAARAIQERVPRDAWVVAPEALLYESDRRGCRLEFTRRSAERAAGEWGARLDSEDPLALVEFYRARGAAYVADVGATGASRLALHEAIRRRYNVLVDQPGVLLAALTSPQDAPDGTRRTRRDPARLPPLETARAQD